MQLTSAAYQQGTEIPVRFTCEGDNISPAFSWRDAPGETKSFALIIHDPDAPRAGGFTHWVLYNIPGAAQTVQENVPKNKHLPEVGTQGRNDADEVGYMGPCPPSGTHRYYARLFALDSVLTIPPGANHEELTEAMEGHILARAELMGKYAKKAEHAA
jgi:Raf kinase inhibitor-like YbhB/YbcL family protein